MIDYLLINEKAKNVLVLSKNSAEQLKAVISLGGDVIFKSTRKEKQKKLHIPFLQPRLVSNPRNRDY